MATASWTYFARRGFDSKVVRISRDRAQSLIRSPARSHTTNPAWLVVWEVPPKYRKEALWRVENGWIAPSWVYHRGGLVGGVYRTGSTDVEPHPPHRTAGSVRAKDEADLRFARHELQDARRAVRRVERRHSANQAGGAKFPVDQYRLELWKPAIKRWQILGLYYDFSEATEELAIAKKNMGGKWRVRREAYMTNQKMSKLRLS